MSEPYYSSIKRTAVHLGLIITLMIAICHCSARHLWASSPAGGIRCTVKYVLDGDSFLAEIDSKPVNVRLWGIDAPEKQQPYARFSKNSLKRLIGQQLVRLQPVEYDRYGRMVAMVFSDKGVNINQKQIENGAAWVHRYYCHQTICEVWKTLELQAQQNGLGLFQEKNPTRPWVWKKTTAHDRQ